MSLPVKRRRSRSLRPSSRAGPARQYLNLMLVFVASGLWHAGPFFDSKSDDQELAWRGGVKKRPNARANLTDTAR